MKKVFMFSGQGSHYYQMGRDLYRQQPVFRNSMDQMDALAQGWLGQSVVQALYGEHGMGEPFDDIRLTHPAIFMVEYALARSLMEQGVLPDMTLGASLGTYAALAVAGWASMPDMLELVIRQGLAIAQHCPKGGMLAVLNDPACYDASPFLQARSVIAGRNFSRHFVLAVPQANMAAVEAYLLRQDMIYQPLLIQYPFHALWIDALRPFIPQVRTSGRVRPSATPVLCCASGGLLGSIPDDYFWQVARSEILFMNAVETMENMGSFHYLDVGPSGTLAGFLKYLLPADSLSQSHVFMKPFGHDVDNFSNAISKLP